MTGRPFPVLAFSALLFGSAARAEAPGGLNPGPLLQQQLQQQLPTIPQSPAPPPVLVPEREACPQDQAPESSRTLALRHVQFNGVKRLPLSTLRQAFAPLIGRVVRVSDLRCAAHKAQVLLRNQGYVTAIVRIPEPIPESWFTSGDLQVQVVESFIETISVQGGTAGLQSYVRKMLQPVVGDPAAPIPFYLPLFERQILLIRRFEAVKIEAAPILKKGQRFGGSELVVQITPAPVKAGISADNNVPLPLGDWRLGANLQASSRNSQPFKLNAIGDNSFPYPGGFVDGIAQLSTPLGNKGWQTDLQWSTTSTSSKDLQAGPTTVQTGGNSSYWALGFNYPLIFKRDALLAVGVKGTWQNSTNNLYVNGTTFSNLSTDRLRALRLTVDGYTTSAAAFNQLSFVLSQGFSGLGSGLSANEFPSNPNGNPNFTTARLNLSSRLNLSNLLQRASRKKPSQAPASPSSTILTIRGTAQASASAVPVPEQFSYGGPFYGRAFNSVYILGDQGWASSLEIGQEFLIKLGNKQYQLMPFAWYDYGFTSQRESLPYQSNQAAATYGIGARGSLLGGNTNFELGWGVPSNNTLNPRRVGSSNSIVYFRVGVGF